MVPLEVRELCLKEATQSCSSECTTDVYLLDSLKQPESDLPVEECVQFKKVRGPQCTRRSSALAYWQDLVYFGKRHDNVQACPGTRRRIMLMHFIDRAKASNGCGSGALINQLYKTCHMNTSEITSILLQLKHGRLTELPTPRPPCPNRYFIVCVYAIHLIEILHHASHHPPANPSDMPQSLDEFCAAVLLFDKRTLFAHLGDVELMSKREGGAVEVLSISVVRDILRSDQRYYSFCAKERSQLQIMLMFIQVLIQVMKNTMASQARGALRQRSLTTEAAAGRAVHRRIT
jgi:hypothetical protein